MAGNPVKDRRYAGGDTAQRVWLTSNRLWLMSNVASPRSLPEQLSAKRPAEAGRCWSFGRDGQQSRFITSAVSPDCSLLISSAAIM